MMALKYINCEFVVYVCIQLGRVYTYKNNFNQIPDPIKVPFGNAFIFSAFVRKLSYTRKMYVKQLFRHCFFVPSTAMGFVEHLEIYFPFLFIFFFRHRRGPSNIIHTAPRFSLDIIAESPSSASPPLGLRNLYNCYLWLP